MPAEFHKELVDYMLKMLGQTSQLTPANILEEKEAVLFKSELMQYLHEQKHVMDAGMQG